MDELLKDKLFTFMVSFFAIHEEESGLEKYQTKNKIIHLYVSGNVPTPKTKTQHHFQELALLIPQQSEIWTWSAEQALR